MTAPLPSRETDGESGDEAVYNKKKKIPPQWVELEYFHFKDTHVLIIGANKRAESDRADNTAARGTRMLLISYQWTSGPEDRERSWNLPTPPHVTAVPLSCWSSGNERLSLLNHRSLLISDTWCGKSKFSTCLIIKPKTRTRSRMSREVRFSLISRFLGKQRSVKEARLSSSIIDPVEMVLAALPLPPERGYLPSSLCGHAPWDLHSLHNPHFQHLISLGLRFLWDAAAERRTHTHTLTHTHWHWHTHKWEGVKGANRDREE